MNAAESYVEEMVREVGYSDLLAAEDTIRAFIRKMEWKYSTPPDANAIRTLATRMLVIQHGRIVKAHPTKTYTSELRPYRYASTVEYATDVEPGYSMEIIQGSLGSDKIWIDLGLRLEYEVPHVVGAKQSVVIGCDEDFSGTHGYDSTVFPLLVRNGHGLGFVESPVICTFLINEFNLKPAFERLRQEFLRLRAQHWDDAKLAAQKHGKKIEASRKRAQTAEAKAKKTEKFRSTAREKMSNDFIKYRLSESFKKFTPEQFFDMYKLVQDNFPAMKEIARWQGQNPVASQAVTLEDIVYAYDIAKVKDVMQS